MDAMNPKVDAYLSRSKKWREETEKLRTIMLDCQLTEELKWGKPCYTFEGNNVAILQGFKEFYAVLFPKGALLKDARGILEKPGESTQSARRVRFTSVREIVELERALKAYVKEAVKVEKAGLKVAFKKSPEPIPEELQAKLDELPAFRKAFEALTPGRQRGYILQISAAKQSKTRASRVEKYIPRILEGKGFHDR